ncbi:MAG: gephyrin-like molybdotransferase Glp [Actinomycetota bacterium]
MISVDEARARVLAAVAPVRPVELRVANALGAVLATDLDAPHALPRFDNSSMDGFAVHASDCGSASPESPVGLRVVGEVRAGDPGDHSVRPGTAARIMTGAPVPPGADAIVPVEETRLQGDRVLVQAPAEPGRFIRRAGEDVQTGDLLIRAGTELRAGELALAASVGASPLLVRPAPRVAVVVTGDELVEPETQPGPGQIRDSNSIALSALVREAGGEALLSTPVPDELGAVEDAFRRAAARADLVVSSGGVAVGDHDFVKEAIEGLGRIDLWRVAMQPGKPVVLGAIGDVPFLGLPGNPVSIHISFEQFVRPAIRRLRGCSALLRPTISARLSGPLDKPAGRLHFVRVRLSAVPGGWVAVPTGPQGSHIQSSLIGCHGVARFPRTATRLADGEEVTVEVWRLPEAEAS